MVVQEKFNKYIQFAKSIVSALPPEEVPVDLTDSLQFIKACDVFVEYHQRLDEDELRDVEETVASGYEPCSSMAKVRCGCRSQWHGRDGEMLREVTQQDETEFSSSRGLA